MACIAERRDRLVIDFYDQHGKRRWKTLQKGTTKTQAKKVLRQLEDRIEKGDYITAKDIPPFPTVADAWLKAKRQRCRETTCNSYQGHIRHLKEYFGKTPVSRINLDSVEKFIAWAREEKGISVATTKKILATLQQIMTYACRKKYANSNPVKEVEKPEDKHEHREEKENLQILTPAQIRELIKATEGLTYKMLVATAAATGMREGELIGLRWDDIDWESRQIQVKRTYNHGKLYPPKTKTSKRKIDIVPQLAWMLGKWKEQCPATELDLVFPNSNGRKNKRDEYITANNMLRSKFYPALEKASLPKVRFHDLRHTYASILIDQGENPKYIQVQMGHSSIQVTYDIYGHLMKTENPESAIKLGNTIFGGTFDLLEE